MPIDTSGGIFLCPDSTGDCVGCLYREIGDWVGCPGEGKGDLVAGECAAAGEYWALTEASDGGTSVSFHAVSNSWGEEAMDHLVNGKDSDHSKEGQNDTENCHCVFACPIACFELYPL